MLLGILKGLTAVFLIAAGLCAAMALPCWPLLIMAGVTMATRDVLDALTEEETKPEETQA